MLLRKIEMRDAPLMLEWMHDKDVIKNLRANFSTKTLEDVKKFISSSWQSTKDYHLAIASDED